MEVKSMVHIILWGLADGIAALWVLHVLGSIVKSSQIAETLLLLANTICG